MNTNFKRKTSGLLHYSLAIVAIFGCIYCVFSTLNSLTNSVSAQQDLYLDRRLNQIEQRFTFIESRINRLEQQSKYPGNNPSSGATAYETEIRLLRTEVDTLRLRLMEAECGLLKIDERTLLNSERQKPKKSISRENDSCRNNPNSPIQLSMRP